MNARKTNFINRFVPKRGIGRNSLFSGIQATIAAAVMFAAYRILVQHVGIENVGLWSLLLGIVTVARVADVTGSAGLSRFVAQALLEQRDAAVYVHTLTIASVLVNIVIASLVVLFSSDILVSVVDGPRVDEGINLVPLIAIVSFILTSLGLVLSSGVDGTHRADLRAILLTGSQIVFIIGVVVGVPQYGLWGWGAALAAQQFFIICGAWFLMRRTIEGLGFFPFRWSNAVLSETVRYGLKLQINSFAGMLSEPIVKFLLIRFGGLEAVGLYELATRIVFALRSVVVQMVMPLVPEFTSLRMRPEKIRVLLGKSFRLSVKGSLCILLGSILSAPVYSLLMLNFIDEKLVYMIWLLALGVSINTVSTPFYFLGIGLNWLRWNIVAQFVMAICVAGIGTILGALLSSNGVILSVVLGHCIGAAIVITGNNKSVSSAVKNG